MSRARVKSQRGFTLIELLVVFAIAGLLVAVVPPAFDRLRQSVQYRAAVRTVLAELKLARSQALNGGVMVRFDVDLGQRTFGVQGKSPHLLPPELELRATVADVEVTSGVAGISFLPQGGATGGNLDVLRPDGSGTRLGVDWLSGQVRLTSISP